jgi:hypothetical protein
MFVKSQESRVESRRNRGLDFQPPAPSPQPHRRAISLTEVLIAMGILTLGLLGVAAIFPVGGYYMQKAEIADRGSAIAQAVMNDIVARGMLNPQSWRVMIPPAGSPPASDPFPSDAKFTPPPYLPYRGTFTRPFGAALGEALNQPAAAMDPTRIGKQFGSAFVLDPLGVAAMAFPNQNYPVQWNAVASSFPATATNVFGSAFSYSAAWQPWSPTWPVRRVTFQHPTNQWQMDATTAGHYFRGSDDLTTDLPSRDDRPAAQNWDVDRNGVPLARQWTGDYSWLVTVVPTTNAARDGMARNPEGFAYDVSVVVFYKRVLPDGAVAVSDVLATSPGPGDEYRKFSDAMGDQERAVRAKVVSTGLNGGELLLTDLGDHLEGKSPFGDLKVGQWIMLCGPHPNSNVDMSRTPPVGEPRFTLNWYQVLSIDGREMKLDANGNPTTNPSEPDRRLVAVRGPQWPWQPSSGSNNVANNLCVAICRGAVAVHTKTLRLEGRNGSSWGITSPSTTEPPNNVPR